MIKMQVVILAGGLATRLGYLTTELPKSMVSILGKPFLEYQLELLRKEGINNIVLCVGHLSEKIENYFGAGQSFGVSITYSHEEKLVGTAGALKKAEAFLDDVFFTLYGDSYVFLDFTAAMSYFRAQDKLALMTVYKNHNQYDKSNTAVESGLVKRYGKLEKTEDMVYIDYGANLFRREVLEMIPKDETYSLDQLFPRLIERQELLSFEVKERFYEIGSPQGLKEFEEYARRSN
jgi:MurNAc alpha-1-phosphate uridylyltransferase